jgi:hypothetical protein
MTDITADERAWFKAHPDRAWTALTLLKMLTAKALIARHRRGAAGSPVLTTGMFAAAPLDIIRVIPTQRFKGTIQSRETTCREPSAIMIVAAVSKLPDQIFHYPSKIRHLSFSSLFSHATLSIPPPSLSNYCNAEKFWRLTRFS